MLKTFRAWLKGNRVEWIDEIPELENRLIQVHVTLLENEPDLEASRGRKMAEILEKLSATLIKQHYIQILKYIAIDCHKNTNFSAKFSLKKQLE